MTRPDFSSDESVAAYRAELRNVGRTPRLAGFILVIAGALLLWFAAPRAGDAAALVQTGGYMALGAGWALMIAAIFMRTRYHRRRMREVS